MFAFSSFRELLVAESGGDFNMDDWEQLYEIAEQLCCGADSEEDDPMQEQEQSIQKFIQNALREKVADDLRWKIR